MISVAVIRHGPTDWNEQKRIQGRADRNLSAAGRERVAGWTVPAELGENLGFGARLGGLPQ